MLLAVLLVSSGFRFRWLGDFYSGEVYATIFFFIHILRKNPIRPTEPKIPKPIKIGFLLWFGFILISSLLNQSSASSLLISCLTVFISFTLLYTFVHVFELGRGLTVNLQYLLLGQVLAAFVQPYNLGISNGWKFQYGLQISVLIIAFLIQKRRLLAILSAFVLGVISLNYSSRNLAMCLFLGGFIALLQELHRNRGFNFNFKANFAFVFVFILISFLSYFSLAKVGFLGERERIRLEVLLTSDQVLIASRPEIFFTTAALRDSPFLGYGSSIDIEQKKLLNIVTMARDNGLLFQGLEKSAYEIPVHSFIMSSMLKGGLLAGFFWFWCFVMGLQCLVRNLLAITSYDAILVITLLWNIWFSPFGASARILSMYAVFCIIQLRNRHMQLDHTPN